MFQKRDYRKKSQKTLTNAVIPIHPIVREILEYYNYQLPPFPYSLQYYNKLIKIICQKAGITQNILLEYKKGNKLVQEICPKYQLVSSHTARRTLITNLYLRNTPLLTIMAISGHRSITNLLLYIRITTEEHIKALTKSGYFNRKNFMIEEQTIKLLPEAENFDLHSPITFKQVKAYVLRKEVV